MLKTNLLMRDKLSLITLLLIILLVSCKKEDSKTTKPPGITIEEISDADVTYTSLTVNGSVSGDENGIKSRGICYSTSTKPTIQDNKVEASANTFKIDIQDLAVNTKYYLRAYVTSSSGTVYSEKEIVKTTLSLIGTMWNFSFTYNDPKYPNNPPTIWNGDVTFYADGTTRYDEQDAPGLYLMFGKYTIS